MKVFGDLSVYLGIGFESNVLESIFGIKANYSYENKQYFFTRIGSEL